MGYANTHAEAAVMLREAREHIEKVGWIQGAEKRATGVCLIRALRDVGGTRHGKEVDAEAHRIVLNLAGTLTIPAYNDRPTTTKDDVLTLLRAAEQCEQDLSTT